VRCGKTIPGVGNTPLVPSTREPGLLVNLHEALYCETGETSRCVVTGHSFKDPASIEQAAAQTPAVTIQPAQLRRTITQLCEV
jgi:threonine synthase